jgi:serine/threonine protein kinase
MSKEIVCGRTLGEVVGSGAYGSIYSIVDGEKKVLKRFKLSSEDNNKGVFRPCEIDVITRLSHPNLLSATSIHTPAENKCSEYAIIMPRANEVLRNVFPKLSIQQRIGVMFEVLSGVAFLHQNDVLHCDLHDRNVVLLDGKAMLIDFGRVRYGGEHPQFISDDWIIMPPEMELKISGQRRMVGKASEAWVVGCLISDIFFGEDNSLNMLRVNYNDKGESSTNYPLTFSYINEYYHTERHIKHALTSWIKATSEEYAKDDLKDPVNRTRLDDFKTYALDATDLIGKLIAYRSSDRITLDQALKHPLFNKRVAPIGMINENKEVYGTLTLELQSQVTALYAKIGSVEQMFLTVDLLYRTIAHPSVIKVNSLDLLGACVWISQKMLPDDHCNEVYLTEIAECFKIVLKHTLYSSVVYHLEAVIITVLNGRLYRHYLYHRCKTLGQLRWAARNVIPNRDKYIALPSTIPTLEIEVVPQLATSIL